MTTQVKKCNCCKEVKSVEEEFSRVTSAKDGRCGTCKVCRRAKDKVRRESYNSRSDDEINAVLVAKFGDDLSTATLKCTSCKDCKPLMEYSSDKSRPFGLSNKCRGCSSVIGKRATDKKKQRTAEEVADTRSKLRPMGVKECNLCLPDLSLDDFYNDINQPDGLTKRCCNCCSAENAAYYEKVRTVKNVAKEGKCCENCGYNNPLGLDFAHYNREEKYRNQAGKPIGPAMIRSLPILIAELEKTRLLCAVCHAMETKKENDAALSEHKHTVYMRAIVAKFRDETANSEKMRRGNCIDCGRLVTSELLTAFDFDHQPKYDKVNNISTIHTITRLMMSEWRWLSVI